MQVTRTTFNGPDPMNLALLWAEARNQLDTAAVFAGLTTVIIIGLPVENLLFRSIERHTVRKWGMQR